MIGERLLELRKEMNLTQDDLAVILNINKHSISSYERNKNEPSDAIKILIANYFNVSVDYLLGITDNPQPYNKLNDTYIRIPELANNKDIKKEILNYAYYLIERKKNTPL